MNWKVIWLPDAENELTEVWLASQRRNEITRASNDLDLRLAANGPSEGESRECHFRIALSPPLAVTFYVDQNQRCVIVVRVWEFE